MTGLAHTRVLFVEGLPGTGKTTAAQRIQRRLQGRGIAASWWREESEDHPATPKELRRTASAPRFADRCLEHWRRFASEKRSAPELSILEGSAFQSSVRFLLEQDVARDEILVYVRAFACVVAPLAPRLVYLEPADAPAFLSGFVYPVRGAQWVTRVSSYLSATPCCRRRGWSGPAGMLEFWLLYRNVCEESLAQLGFPVLRLATGPGRWDGAEAELGRWLDGEGVPGGVAAASFPHP